MNWMIDGLYGDLYKTAMGYNGLPSDDEWEIERRKGQPAKSARRKPSRSIALVKSWAGRLASQIRGITAAQPSFERKVS